MSCTDLSWNMRRGGALTCDGNLLRLDGEAISTYEFRENYYFFCGDNVINSKDCRYLGFVPEEFIIGVACRITYSEDPLTGVRRPGRWWKAVGMNRRADHSLIVNSSARSFGT